MVKNDGRGPMAEYWKYIMSTKNGGGVAIAAAEVIIAALGSGIGWLDSAFPVMEQWWTAIAESIGWSRLSKMDYCN